ncbi:MSMEG_0570 family nitrogen starvation response protein [Pannus brasiliensis CCIBt3594]|uniref:MSMEG_0570 family nitrogen starvation response protein n=1 Tax=Pannus brasiliensis CCIBt3594 TaxID=1427578 RepID=A0AAW9QJK6_9CHRO
MPEVRFQIRWPDGTEEICYSPSLVVKRYLESEVEYELADFLERSRAALREGSDRVKAKFGYPCGLASAQLQSLETTAARYSDRPSAKVKLLKFIE